MSLGVIRGWYRSCEMIVLGEIDEFDLRQDEQIRSCLQMLWKGTTSIDCASARRGDGGVYVVCQYYPSLSISDIKDNIVPSSDWIDLSGYRSTDFDFSSAALQIKTSFQSNSKNIFYFHTSKIQQKTVDVTILLSSPKNGITGLRIGSKFCGNSYFSAYRNFILRHTKNMVLYTFFISPEKFYLFVDGKEAVKLNIPEIVTDNSCMDKLRRLASSKDGRVDFHDQENDLVQYRAIPSSRLPQLDEEMRALKYNILPQVTDFRFHPGENESVSQFITEVVTEAVPTKSENEDSVVIDPKKNRHFIIKDKSGKEIKVTFPAISTTFSDRGDGSIKVYIDRDEQFEGIESFQLIVQHSDPGVESDEGALSYTDTLYEWQDAERMYREDEKAVPYIAAEVKQLNDFFILGDEMTYGGYFNGKVTNSRRYSLRVRGIVQLSNNEQVVIDTTIVGTFKSAWVTWLSSGGALTLLIITSGFVVFHIVRKKRERRRVQETIAKFNTLLEDNHPPPTLQNTTHDNVIDDVTAPTSEEGEVGGANHVISPPLEHSDWWDVSESEEPGPAQEDQYNSPENDKGGEWDTMRSTTQLNAAEYSAIEAATKLISETDKNIVRRKSTVTPSQINMTRSRDMVMSNEEIDLPDYNIRQDEMYHF